MNSVVDVEALAGLEGVNKQSIDELIMMFGGGKSHKHNRNHIDHTHNKNHNTSFF